MESDDDVVVLSDDEDNVPSGRGPDARSKDQDADDGKILFQMDSDDDVMVLSDDEDNAPSGCVPDARSKVQDINDGEKSVEEISSSEDDEDESLDDDDDSESDDDESTSAETKTKEEEEEEDEYSDWDEKDDVMTIKDSDDEEEEKLWDPKQKMVCMRCPDVKTGTFKDKKKYLFHIKRHTFGEHFSCPTCKRPFTKLIYCISHEIRVHGAQINQYSTNQVVKFAKEYARKKALKPVPLINLDDEDENENEIEWDTDEEDVKFYENRVICSNAFMRYQGPDVDHWIESYEIVYHHAGEKYRDRSAREVAKTVLDKHRSNVGFSQDVFRLGKFSKKKEKPPAIVQKLPCEIEEEEENGRRRALTLTSGTSTSEPSSAVSGLGPPEENNDDGPQGNRKKRKVVCSSKSNKEQEPCAKKKTNDASTNPNFQKSAPKAKSRSQAVHKPKLRRTKRRSTGYSQSKKVLPAAKITTQTCRKCPYQWGTEEDLRRHRDMMHPNINIDDLMNVPNFVPSRPVTRGRRKEIEDDHEHLFKVMTRSAMKKQKTDRDLQMKQKLSLFTVDESFSEKEKFLHSLGIVNKLRLQLHEKKPLKDLKLKKCLVRLN